MKLWWISLAACLAVSSMLTSSAAFAQPETEEDVQARLARPDYARGGYYVGMEGLVSVENSASIGQNAYLVSGGLDIRLGNRHNRWLATELYGVYIHTYGDGTGQFLAWGMSVAERLYLTRARFQPYVTVGVGFLQVRSRNRDFAYLNPGETDLSPGFDPGFAPYFGVGMEMYATENVAFTLMASYHLTVGNISGFDFVSAGLGMMFF